MGLLFILMMVLLVICFVGVIAVYIFYSLGLYTLAKNQNLKNAGLAWVPVLNRYLIGELTGNILWNFQGSKWILAFGPLVCLLLMPLGVGFILEIVYYVYYFFALYKLYKIYAPENADIFTIFSILFRFVIGIFLYVIRNNSPYKETVEMSETNWKENRYFNNIESGRADTINTKNISASTSVNDNFEIEQSLTFDYPDTYNETSIKEEVTTIPEDSKHKEVPNIDFDELNRNIEAIKLSAKKASDEAPGKKPIELSLNKDPRFEFSDLFDDKGE